jgi:uncharacterized protein (DUF362 family)/Pyruvate/2-oxoacid:ferredoxin oxidoreductase delta subunit
MADVALVKCDSYSPKLVKEKILEGLGFISFDPGSFRNARVALKPNLLSAVRPISAVVTHPQFFQAMAEIVIDYGGMPVLIESPAVASLENAMRSAGYKPVVDTLGIKVADTMKVRRITYEQANLFKHFEIADAFFDVDLIVNIPKLKTHGLTYITAAVKNLFGAIPGMRKSQMHLRFPGKKDFSESILDLYGAFLTVFEKPGKLLHVMDAVVSLEGDGPGSSGSPRKTGAIILGEDALAVDYVAVELAGLDMNLATTVTSGLMREFGISSSDEICVKGERLADMKIHDFLPPKSAGISQVLSGSFLGKILKNLLVEKPVPSEGNCTLCYQCRHICPADAISSAEGVEKIPKFNYQRCIRCFCCQEICPEAAIIIEKGKMQWVLNLI